MENRKHKSGMAAAILGAVLMLAGALALHLAGDMLQYAFPAPGVTKEGRELEALYEAGMEQLASMADTLPVSAIGARRQGVSLSAGDGKNAQATLYAVGEGYFEAAHETLMAGRLISGADVALCENVVVIDEKTALAFYPGMDPVGQQLTLEGKRYEVAGVIAGGRRIGEADAAIAYMPITACAQNALQMDTVQVIARSADATGAAILMEDTLGAWQRGSFYHLDKMRLGALMPLRWCLLFLGVCVLLALLRRVNAAAMARIGAYRARLSTQYLRQMLPGVLLWVAAFLALYAALVGGAYALAVFAVEPLYVFTEWVPEVVVEMSSLLERFWALNDAHAAAVRCVTREVCVLELGQGLMQWGLMFFLLGLALRGSKLRS